MKSFTSVRLSVCLSVCLHGTLNIFLKIYIRDFMKKKYRQFLISNLRHVLNAVCFLLGNSPTYEFYMSTFRNAVCSIFTPTRL